MLSVVGKNVLLPQINMVCIKQWPFKVIFYLNEISYIFICTNIFSRLSVSKWQDNWPLFVALYVDSKLAAFFFWFFFHQFKVPIMGKNVQDFEPLNYSLQNNALPAIFRWPCHTTRMYPTRIKKNTHSPRISVSSFLVTFEW